MLTLQARFDTKVLRTDSCWLWQGAKNSKGYGQLRVSGHSVLAHRLAYERFVGQIPGGLNVCHSFDRPSCVNPVHLFTGTCAENTADMMRKGHNRYRPQIGTAHHAAKMNDDLVRQIRVAHQAGASINSLAESYGLHFKSMWCICRGFTWRHVQEQPSC